MADSNYGGGGDVSRTLKEALFETLSAILSPIHNVRASAEEQLKILEVTEDFGIHLAELTVDSNGILAVRQLASVLLKQYVDIHWSAHADKFRPPETSENAKGNIRRILPIGLQESISKVRSSVAYAITAIAHWDWPESWPELFIILMQSLTSGDSNAVHGAMRVLAEFSREVSDLQMPEVAPVILPEMYRIFMEPQKYTIRTRGRAVEIFCTCASMIINMAEHDKDIAKTLLFPTLPTFTEALVQALQITDANITDSGLKLEIVKALTILLKNFPRQMSAWLPQVLPTVWKTLTESAEIYIRTNVRNIEDVDEAVDSDGEVLGFENLIFSIFEFVHGLIETPRLSGMVNKGLTELLYYIVLYMQITEDQTQTWTTNPDQFVEDEDDDTFSYTVRISAQDLLSCLAEEFEEETVSGLYAAVTKHLQEAEVIRAHGNVHWWKIHEACMLALGSIKSFVISQLQEGKAHFDVNSFLQSVILPDLNSSVSQFLVGRCLWTASRFAVVMDPNLTQRFLQATVHGLHENQPPSVRVSSMRAVWGYSDHLKSSNNIPIMIPFLPQIMEGLISLATQFSSDVLSLVIETLAIVLSVDATTTANYESKITPLTIAVFLKHNHDPVMMCLIQDVFKELSKNEQCRQPLHQRLLPTLISILNASSDKVPMGLQAVVLDTLQTLIRNSSQPLAPAFISQAFPAVAHCVLRTDDSSTMQSGGECLRAYVSEASTQIVNWQNEQGQNGLWFIVQVASQLLNPRTSEFTAAFVGRLVTTLINKAGDHLGEYLDLLLKAVLSKMQQAETLSVIQSLVMVFAHLIHSKMEAVMVFLSGIPGPTGKSALEFVLTEWTSKQHLFYGSYERKVSSSALCKLLEHGVTTNDPRLGDIRVKGDPVMMKSDPEEWTVIPLLVKIYKLVINELATVMENDVMFAKSEVESNDLEEESDDESEVNENVLNFYAPASDYSDYSEQMENEEDLDALADPLYHINLQRYLTEFLNSFCQQPYYSIFSIHLTSQEREVLQLIGINS
uniref:Importin N-terminal domain-containing protein n=1 Tax=Strigamia maritima TaxID=126957 RepID=T1IP27_STRMM